MGTGNQYTEAFVFHDQTRRVPRSRRRRGATEVREREFQRMHWALYVVCDFGIPEDVASQSAPVSWVLSASKLLSAYVGRTTQYTARPYGSIAAVMLLLRRLLTPDTLDADTGQSRVSIDAPQILSACAKCRWLQHLPQHGCASWVLEKPKRMACVLTRLTSRR